MLKVSRPIPVTGHEVVAPSRRSEDDEVATPSRRSKDREIAGPSRRFQTPEEEAAYREGIREVLARTERERRELFAPQHNEALAARHEQCNTILASLYAELAFDVSPLSPQEGDIHYHSDDSGR